MTSQVIVALGLAASFATAFATAFFFGGRRWRSNYEAEYVRAERLQATMTEKDLALTTLQAEKESMSARLARLDEERKEFGGSRVYEAIVEQQRENVQAFAQLAEMIATMQKGMVDEIARVGDRVVRCLNNGEGRR